MLQTLKIENVALIEQTTLQFDEKLNVISGETGAGKSIMLDALSFVFGGRADKTLIRSGANSMKVEAIFTNLSNKQKLFIINELNISCDDEMFLSREIDVNGRNICKINGELVPVASVKKICQMLTDVHGQSEHLSILDNAYQLKIIDLYSKIADEKLINLNAKIDKLKNIENQIKDLGGSETEKQNLIDLYSYQINEINNAKIMENEYEELSLEKKEMQQFEKVNENLRTAYEANCKNGFTDTASDKISVAIKSMRNISELNPQYNEILNRLESLRIELEDINDTVADFLHNNIFDQERFEYVDNRLDFIKSLFRKYGGDYENLTKYFEEIKVKLDNLINGQAKYEELNNQKEKVLNEIDKMQEDLSKIRKDSAVKLKEKMQEELRFLGMPNAVIDIEFSRIVERYSTTGFDKVEFMFSSNLGFEPRALNKVVSGGEMSRVMLAYKIVVSNVDDIHTIVFDEIDSGLSGNIAMVVAQYMARLSLNKQIIAVSHLPQICAMADFNIQVEKYDKENRTHTRAKILNNDELLKEIARLMGADNNNLGLNISSELKDKCNLYKSTL